MKKESKKYINMFSWTPFILQIIVYPITRPALHFFVKICVFGKENISGHKSGAIFAVNHSSELDPILIPATLNPFSSLFPMFYIAREREFYRKSGLSRYFYGGTFFKIWGAYPVKVGEKGDYEKSLEHHISILEQEKSVCIFPEGGKTKDGNIGEGKPGVAYLLWRTGRPVVPVAIHGHRGMGFADFLKRKHSISIFYCKPITREELFGFVIGQNPPSLEELKFATEIIMSRIRSANEGV